MMNIATVVMIVIAVIVTVIVMSHVLADAKKDMNVHVVMTKMDAAVVEIATVMMKKSMNVVDTVMTMNMSVIAITNKREEEVNEDNR